MSSSGQSRTRTRLSSSHNPIHYDIGDEAAAEERLDLILSRTTVNPWNCDIVELDGESRFSTLTKHLHCFLSVTQIQNLLQTFNGWSKNCHVVSVEETSSKNTANVASDTRFLQYDNEFINIYAIYRSGERTPPWRTPAVMWNQSL